MSLMSKFIKRRLFPNTMRNANTTGERKGEGDGKGGRGGSFSPGIVGM